MKIFFKSSLTLFLAILIAACSNNPSHQHNTDSNEIKTDIKNLSSLSASERNLNLTGAPNARDLGGIVNKDGKRVKSNLLIRTDQLGALTEQDLKKLSDIPVLTVVDFRTEDEIKKSADKNPASVKKAEKISVLSGNLDMAMQEVLAGKLKVDDYMMSMYQSFGRDADIIKKYKDFFGLVQNPENTAIVYHCTAGKDRTGMATALILSALDVSYDEIMKDYLASNEHPLALPADLLKEHPDLKNVTGVKTEYLNAAFDEINKNYGNVPHFLTNELGVDIDKMKELYLEK